MESVLDTRFRREMVRAHCSKGHLLEYSSSVYEVILIVNISQLAAFMYYQQPMGYMAPRQAMYHYQNQQLRSQRRSAGVSAFAAGNTVGSGTYLKGKL